MTWPRLTRDCPVCKSTCIQLGCGTEVCAMHVLNVYLWCAWIPGSHWYHSYDEKKEDKNIRQNTRPKRQITDENSDVGVTIYQNSVKNWEKNWNPYNQLTGSQQLKEDNSFSSPATYIFFSLQEQLQKYFIQKKFHLHVVVQSRHESHYTIETDHRARYPLTHTP